MVRRVSFLESLVDLGGLEPPTPSMRMTCSTAELQARVSAQGTVFLRFTQECEALFH